MAKTTVLEKLIAHAQAARDELAAQHEVLQQQLRGFDLALTELRKQQKDRKPKSTRKLAAVPDQKESA
jgi:hypothetical protein